MNEVTRKRVSILAAAIVGAALPQLVWRRDRFRSRSDVEPNQIKSRSFRSNLKADFPGVWS